jgi:hypothetical protein
VIVTLNLLIVADEGFPEIVGMLVQQANNRFRYASKQLLLRKCKPQILALIFWNSTKRPESAESKACNTAATT